MGTDKALIEIDGVPMAERVARVLEAAGCEPVVFVGGDPVLAELGRRLEPDRYPGDGPVGGVITALHALGDSEAVVVAACDLPDLTVDAVQAVMGTAPERAEIRVADSGRMQPGLACWPTLRLQQIEDNFRVARALHEIIDNCGAIRVPVDITALRNVNQPNDW